MELGPQPEFEVFKIAKSYMPGDMGAPSRPALPGAGIVAHFCDVEAWSADLGTGIFKLGDFARGRHGLPEDGDCGLLTLVRCYDGNDRRHVLDLFEAASLDASSFCFSTTIIHADGVHRPLLCVGESSKFTGEGSGALAGVFMFPRFAVDPAAAHSVQ